MSTLLEKYNVAVPRYTSYPAVPHWRTDEFSVDSYVGTLRRALAPQQQANGVRVAPDSTAGVALYIHLPYCESLCTYCGCNTRITVNHKVESPYIDSLLSEWQLYLSIFAESGIPRPLIREIHLGGGTPTFFAPAQLERLLKGILSSCTVSVDASFSFEAHPANTTLEHLSTLRQLGFDRLSLGVQDFDEVVQKAINRRQSTEDVMRITAEARKLGYRSVNFDLVYGLPFQRQDGFADTVAAVIAMQPDRIALYGYAHVPWKHPGQRAYGEADLPNPEARLALFASGRDMFITAGYQAIGLDHFALPTDSLAKAYNEGTMHRNFMGYTDLRTDVLIGLGVSAISDTGMAYAQNDKTVEDYRNRVAAGNLPVHKGHLRDSEEQFIGRHIRNLLCQHTTSWTNAEVSEKKFMQSRLSALRILEADGMVVLGPESITINAKGKPFARNVCAVIDKYFIPVDGISQFAASI